MDRIKYIIIKGSVESGKYTTITEVCNRLNPESIRVLHVTGVGKGILSPYNKYADTENNNYIVCIKKRYILVVATSPTEQRVTITTIIKAAKNAGVSPDLAIISMRGRERLDNFSTATEISAFGNCLHETKISRIPAINYKSGDEWNKRINHLLNIIKLNL